MHFANWMLTITEPSEASKSRTETASSCLVLLPQDASAVEYTIRKMKRQQYSTFHALRPLALLILPFRRDLIKMEHS